MNKDQLQAGATDPMAFFSALLVESPRGIVPFGQIMQPFQRQALERLSPDLLALASGEQPPIGRHAFFWTKGCGKDTIIDMALIWLLVFSGRTLEMRLGAGDFDQAAEIRLIVRGLLRLNPLLSGTIEVLTQEIRNSRPNGPGSRVLIVAADERGEHGARPSATVIQELVHTTNEEFVQTLLDNQAKVPAGLLIIASNAGTVGTLAHRIYEMVRDSDRWHVSEFNEPAPWINEADLAERKRVSTATRHRRLWYGEWAEEGAGDALDPDDIEACITQTGPIPPGIGDFSPTHCGIDLGIRRDCSGLVVLATDFRVNKIRVARVQRWLPADYGGTLPVHLVKEAILKAHNDYGLFSLIGDPWESRYLCQELAREMPGVFVATPAINPAFQNQQATCLMSSLRERTLVLYPDVHLLRDLRKLSVIEKPEGFRLFSPRDSAGHADCAAALATVLPTAVQVANEIIAERMYLNGPERVYA